MEAGKILRVITSGPAVLHWGVDSEIADTSATETFSELTALSCWYADLPTAHLGTASKIEFYLDCEGELNGEHYQVAIL
jgi:hypothetical protein